MRYVAIGVFGTDVYDTLMVLEALRPVYPHALFFTTDLDARFLHPRHIEYTRNLVVASHHPLRVLPRSGGAIEFRDTYQTSVYRAVELALRPDARAEVPRPLLHELGNRNAVLLDPPTGAAECGRSRGESKANGGRAAEDALLAAAGAPGSTPLLAPVVAIALVLGVLGVRRRRGSFTWLVLLAALSLWATGAWILARAAADGSAREPLELFAGVSVWPAVLMRLAAFFYCLLAIEWIRRSRRDMLRRIEVEHRLLTSADDVGESKWRTLRWLLGAAKERGPKDVAVVWSHADAVFRPRLLWPRLVVHSVIVYVASAPLLMMTTPPPAPVRGEFAYVAERWTLGLSLIAFFMLFSFVIELTFLSVCLIRRLTDRHATLLPSSAPRGAGVRSEKRIRSGATLDHKRRLDLVRDVTRAVERLVHFPMLAIVAFVFAPSSLFDSWVWFPALVIALSGFFLVLLGCVVALRVSARDYLERALAHLDQRRQRHAADEPQSRWLAGVRDYLGSFRGGAFSPLVEHPIVRAVLLILLGLATTLALERRLDGSHGPWF